MGGVPLFYLLSGLCFRGPMLPKLSSKPHIHSGGWGERPSTLGRVRS